MAGAIILAGGGSRRMGRDKAWLELGGRPLLLHVIEVVAGRCRPIVVSARRGQELPLPGDGELAGELVRVDDPEDGEGGGPLIGLAAALEVLAARGAALAYLGSCDAAALSAAHVDAVLERLAATGARAVVPRDAEGIHPLASALRVAPMLAEVRARLAAGDLRLRGPFEASSDLGSGPGELEVLGPDELPDPRVLDPCNTPAQWQALRAILERSRLSPEG